MHNSGYTKQAIGRDPKEFSGVINALRFGFKAAAGWAFGVIAMRTGARTPLVISTILLGGSVAWTWGVPGYLYLLAFGWMGAGELGGAYFYNFALALSTPATGARNLAILSLATPASSIAPAINGYLTDHYGFAASFLFAISTSVFALTLMLKLPARPSVPTMPDSAERPATVASGSAAGVP